MTLIVIIIKKVITLILKTVKKMTHPLTDTVIGITLEKRDVECLGESR